MPGADKVMAELIAAAEGEYRTDFAINIAAQPEPRGAGVSSMSYAASEPGHIHMICGTKYAFVHTRLERWDSRPPPADDAWEDRDEIPFQAVPDGGPLIAHGFDSAPPPGLDLDGLDRVRVEVLARGRHRYHYSSDDHTEHLEPERWLLRLWPDAPGADALTGPPRRVAGPLPFDFRLTPWQHAVRSWNNSGWTYVLLRAGSTANWIQTTLQLAGRPLTRDEFDVDWNTPADGLPYMASTASSNPPLQAVADAVGMRSIETYGDVLTALVKLDVLLRVTSGDGERFVPNPAPPFPADRIPMDEAELKQLHVQIGYANFRVAMFDVEHVLEWAEDHRLEATAQRVATRLAVHPGEVLGGIKLLKDLGKVTVEPDPPWSATTPLIVRRTLRSRRP